MLDFDSDTPSARPPAPFLRAVRASADVPQLVSSIVEATKGPGLFAERNIQFGGFHVGRHTLIRVNGGEPQTWEKFAADNASLGRGELRAIFANLTGAGLHMDATATFTVAVMPAMPSSPMSDARLTAEADLARLDAAFCQFADARRRYEADTASNAWSLEQAALDVGRAAQAVARSFGIRAEMV